MLSVVRHGPGFVVKNLTIKNDVLIFLYVDYQFVNYTIYKIINKSMLKVNCWLRQHFVWDILLDTIIMFII